jgi:hypothetical protein
VKRGRGVAGVGWRVGGGGGLVRVDGGALVLRERTIQLDLGEPIMYEVTSPISE